MAEVTVSFKIEGDDPGDRLGISEEKFIEIEDTVAQLGGYDTEYEKEL